MRGVCAALILIASVLVIVCAVAQASVYASVVLPLSHFFRIQ